MEKATISIPVQVNESAAAVYAESLKMILQHVAEFHITVVDIISEKYNIPVDEIMKTVTSDSRYTNMLVDPKIHRLTSLNQDKDQYQYKCCIEKTIPLENTRATTATTATTVKKNTERKIKIKPKPQV